MTAMLHYLRYIFGVHMTTFQRQMGEMLLIRNTEGNNALWHEVFALTEIDVIEFPAIEQCQCITANVSFATDCMHACLSFI
jgi:hypothetical protein